MDKVKINTTQNITIEYELANPGYRIISCLIDLLIQAGLGIGIFILFEILLPKRITIAEELKYIIYLISFIIIFMYDLICETALGGQSLGKKIIGIKVIKTDGSQPGFISYLLRWVFRIIEIYMTYGSLALITIMMNGKGQRIGDIAAGTAVVSIRNKDSIDDTIYLELDEDYKAEFEFTVRLSEEDIRTVKEVIEFAKSNKKSKSAKNIMSKVRGKIETIIGTESDMEDLPFLKTVLKDYNVIHNR